MSDTDKNRGVHKPEEQTTAETAAATKRKPWWRRCIKITAWVLGSLVALLVIVMCLVAWILTPERLTPLVEKYGSQYLKADVKVERVELTVWSSFPSVELDVKGLKLTSRSLEGQPDSVLRACGPDAPQLLDAGSLHGSINPWKLLGGTISLGDITASEVSLNLVTYAPGVNNFDIIPPSEDKEESSPWKIRFGDVNLSVGGFVRYFDAQSGLDVRLANPSLRIRPADADCHKLLTRLGGKLSLAMCGTSYLHNWPLTLEGPVNMNLETMDFDLPDYSIELAIFKLRLKAALALGDVAQLKRCELQLEPLALSSLLKTLPDELLDEYPALRRIDTDMALAVNAKVACPWRFDTPDLPDMRMALNIPECGFTLRDETDKPLIALTGIALQADMAYNGKTPERSSVRVPLLRLSGTGIDLDMDARVEELLGDNPLVSVASRGTLDLSALTALLPGGGSLLGGRVEADAEVKGRMEDIMALRYENFDANGSVQIRDLVCKLPSLAMNVYSRVANIAFGNALQEMGPRVPGTLLARAEIDTLSYSGAGINVGVRDASLRAGTSDKLLSRSASSREITPMGMEFKAGRLHLESAADTTKMKARNLHGNGSLTRYEGNATAPLLKAALSADRLRYSDPTMRLGMRRLEADVNVHPRRSKGKKNHEGLTKKAAREHVIRMEMDQGVKDLLKQWGISGNLKSDRVRLTHLMYPVPMNVTGLNLDFSLDSVRLHSAHIQTQRNALTLFGEIGNLRRFMLGRTRKPLMIRLNADIDSLDLNQVTFNFMLGSAMSAQRGYLARLSADEQEAIVRAAAAIDTVKSLSSDSLPLIIPRNIDAIMHLKAANTIYGDIGLHNMRADLIVNDGAASIDSLQASTDFGNAYLNLLYSSRNPELLNLAVDLGFSDINLQNFYSTFPQIAATAPALTDLSGMVGARLVGSMDMYPNMDIDFNSLNAVLNITGSQLRLEQSPLIRKVARMMLIRKKGALEITDMDIQLALHDNVLRLYPFKFGMEKYRFALLGENDMSQNMFYHLSVLKSPIPFKFGINVKGTFDKPKLRFGGAKYKENEAQEMVSLIDTQRVNFVHAMRLELRRLINKAALTYSDSPQYQRYGIDKELKKANGTDEPDDTGFTSPTDMLTSSLKTPVLKALGNGAAFGKQKAGEQQKHGKKEKKKKKQ